MTKRLRLIGAARYAPELFTEVAQHYKVPHRPGAIDTRVAKHLAGAYGDRAFEVTRLAEEVGDFEWGPAFFSLFASLFFVFSWVDPFSTAFFFVCLFVCLIVALAVLEFFWYSGNVWGSLLV